mgnify:CR=1 FL=1
MNSKLVILANSKPMALPDDFNISVELSNPIFNDVEMFSYPCTLPMEGNRHVFKNLDDVNSDIRPVNYEHTPMQIIADGVPFTSGPAVMQEDEAVSDSISLNVDASTQSFSDLISDLKCRDIQIPSRYHDQLLIGEKIDEVNVEVTYKTDVVIKYEGKKGDKKYGSVGNGYHMASTFSPQALGFSFPAKCIETGSLHAAQNSETRKYPDGHTKNMPKIAQSYINVSDAYPIKPFCNARVCYKHYGLSDDGTTSSDLAAYKEENIMYEDNGKIWVLEADRPQSGICFYVLFFLDCLFEYLGLSFDKSALTAVGDFNRLCFFTTKCAYDTEPLYYGTLYDENDAEVIAGKKKAGDIKLGFFKKQANSEKECSNLFDDVNNWLDSRGCGGKLTLENPKDKTMQEIVYYKAKYSIVEKDDPRFPNSKRKVTTIDTVPSGEPLRAKVGVDKVASITTKSTIQAAQMSASIVRMYANEQNFPDESVSTIIESLENQFGIKFSYDYERKKVTAYLIRDVFRKQNPQPRAFHAQIHEMIPITEKITGVRVGYSAESDSKEQKDYVKYKEKSYNTDYDYIEYPKGRTVTNEIYRDIIHEVYNNQMNVFIDLTTGNKYRVKIDSNFSDANNMNPSLFEVGAYKGVEVGDCSKANEDYVQEFKSDFVPVGMVDVNYNKALSASYDSIAFTDSKQQPTSGSHIDGYVATQINPNNAKTIMAALVDDDMEHEFVKQYIKNPLSSQVADFYVVEELSLTESYDPSKTDDGNSPLQSHNWELSIAIMRGGGTDSDVENYDYNYDGFGNSKWRTTVGEYALTTDSVDNYGNVYDYNGKLEGIGNEERFSLKPRAWVQPDWADTPLVVEDPLIKNRGYFDTFMVDYAYFLLNRKKYRIKCSTSVAQLADIQNHWKEWWLINGKKSLINKVNATITAKDGMGEVELEVYSL